MDNIQLSQVNQAYIAKQEQDKNVTAPITSESRQVEDGENKMNKVLIGLGILGAAGIAVACILNGRKPKNIPNSDDVQKLVKQFQDIDFNKGTAKLNDGTLFTGVIEDTLKSGEKVTMEYVDGVLQKSTKTTNGTKIIKEYTNGVISKKNGEVVDIQKIQNEVKAQQNKLKQLLTNNKISSEEFKKQSDEIKYKSKKQETQIQEVFDNKVKVEKAAKEETERLAKEAQKKAAEEAQEKAAKEEAERLAKEAQEKAFADFKNSLKNMSDEELDNTYNEVIAKRNQLWQKAQKAAEQKGVKSSKACDILDTLSKVEKQEYDLLEKKIDVIGIQQQNRRYDYLNKILCKPEDKKLIAKHSATYRTKAECDELIRYYDDYQCNDAYRGAGKACINVDEEIMDGLFKKAPALEEEAVVYRAVHSAQKSNQGFIDSFKDGFVIENPGYTSTATIVDKQFYQFAGNVANKTEDGVLMRIHLPKGTKGVLGGHNEYLLPRNSQIKVNKIEIIDGVKVADCEYILP